MESLLWRDAGRGKAKADPRQSDRRDSPFSNSLLYGTKSPATSVGKTEDKARMVEKRQHAMDSGGKRVRTDTPSTDSQGKGRKPEEMPIGSTQNRENSARERYERALRGPEICIVPHNGELSGARAHGRTNRGEETAGWLQTDCPRKTSKRKDRSSAERASPNPGKSATHCSQRFVCERTGEAENPRRICEERPMG